MSVRLCDETELGFGWLPAEPETMERCSHALLAGDGVWVIDPVDGEGIDERVRALGRPAGVLVCLDRHQRDAEAIAARLGVPVHQTPFGGVDGAPFEPIPVLRSRLWKEVALWWAEQRLLLVPEAVGTVDYFRAPDEALGVHPMLRALPPRRALEGLDPEHLLVGHGPGLHGPQVGAELRACLARSRTSLPAWGLARARDVLAAARRRLG